MAPFIGIVLVISSYFLAEELSKNAGKYDVNKLEKDVVIILDILTKDKKTVAEFPIDLTKYVFLNTNGKIITAFARQQKTHICTTNDEKLIVGFSGNQVITIYSSEGVALNSLHLNYNQLPNTFDEKKAQSMMKVMEDIRKKSNPDLSEEALKLKIDKLMSIQRKYYELVPYKPYYYDIKIDSDNNVLVFKEGEENSFVHDLQVYSIEGKFLCESKLHLAKGWIHSKSKLLEFYNGYLYGLAQQSKGTSGKMRLIRMNLLD